MVANFRNLSSKFLHVVPEFVFHLNSSKSNFLFALNSHSAFRFCQKLGRKHLVENNIHIVNGCSKMRAKINHLDCLCGVRLF